MPVMRINFAERAQNVERDLVEVEQQLAVAPDDQRVRLEAIKASLKRSLQWYRARAGTRTDKHALGAAVSDDIRFEDATV